jgi:hypothetical protein
VEMNPDPSIVSRDWQQDMARGDQPELAGFLRSDVIFKDEAHPSGHPDSVSDSAPPLCSVMTCLGRYCLKTATMFPERRSRLCKYSDDSHHRGNVS